MCGQEEEKEQPASFKRLLQLNSPEWLVVLAGTVMSVICGLSQPCFAFIFSEFLRVSTVAVLYLQLVLDIELDIELEVVLEIELELVLERAGDTYTGSTVLLCYSYRWCWT